MSSASCLTCKQHLGGEILKRAAWCGELQWEYYFYYSMDPDVAKHIFKVHMHAFFSQALFPCILPLEMAICTGITLLLRVAKQRLPGWNAGEEIFALGQKLNLNNLLKS